jgi:hypothetical protein
MKQVSFTELKKMNISEMKAAIPCQVMVDGVVIAELRLGQDTPGGFVAVDIKKPQEDISYIKTKCPNCKMVYQARRPDAEPNFLSMQQKIGG